MGSGREKSGADPALGALVSPRLCLRPGLSIRSPDGPASGLKETPETCSEQRARRSPASRSSTHSTQRRIPPAWPPGRLPPPSPPPLQCQSPSPSANPERARPELGQRYSHSFVGLSLNGASFRKPSWTPPWSHSLLPVIIEHPLVIVTLTQLSPPD